MNIGKFSFKKKQATMFHKFVKVAFSRKYLLFTNVSISFCLSGAGDILEQRYELLTNEIVTTDYRRTFNMSVTGLTVGVLCHYWYTFLDRRIPGHTIGIVMKKIFLDQVISSPISITGFFATLALLERSSLEEFVENLKEKAWKLYAAEWVVWPTAQFVNFYFLPSKYRVLYDSTISLGYDIYTSHVAYFGRNKTKSNEVEDS